MFLSPRKSKLWRGVLGHDCCEATDDLVHQRLRDRFETPPAARLKIEGARLVAADNANRSSAGISQRNRKPADDGRSARQW